MHLIVLSLRGVHVLREALVVYCLHFFLEPNFYLPKYSLFNTDRLLIEFNGLWYSLAARQVFVAIANPGVSAFSGLECWTGVLDWSAGLECWTGVLDWSTGVESLGWSTGEHEA